MNDEDIRRVIMALLGESADVPVTEGLPTDLVDALRERLRAHDGGDHDRDRNLLAAYLAGELDSAGQLELGNRLLTADDVNARSRQKTAGSGRIGAAPRVYPTPDNEVDIAERLRDARRWTNRLEEATLPAPASFADAAVEIQLKRNVSEAVKVGFPPTWFRIRSWRPVASIASIALVFVVGLNLIGRDLQIQPDEGFAPAPPVDRDMAEPSPTASERVAPASVAPVENIEGFEEVIVTGSRSRRDGLPSSPQGLSGGSGLLRSLDNNDLQLQRMEIDQSQYNMQEVERLAGFGTTAYDEGRFGEAAIYFEAAISVLQNAVPADYPLLVRLNELRDGAVLARDQESEKTPPE